MGLVRIGKSAPPSGHDARVRGKVWYPGLHHPWYVAWVVRLLLFALAIHCPVHDPAGDAILMPHPYAHPDHTQQQEHKPRHSE
jgi:hypothetical protein